MKLYEVNSSIRMNINNLESSNSVSKSPCSICSMIDQCAPGQLVNPEECKYMQDWLDAF